MNAEDNASRDNYGLPRSLIDLDKADVLYSGNMTLIELFEQQVKKNPGNIALVHNDEFLTYQELEMEVNNLAFSLLQSGVQREMLIPICVERSFEMIIGLIAIMKTGAAYTPLDPSYPEERIRYILEDINASFILTTASLSDKFLGNPELKIIFLNNQTKAALNNDPQNIPDASAPADVAYVIYTSGSTGKPKGVLVEHRSIVNFILNQSTEFGIRTDDSILQTTNYAFDPSLEQIFLALCNGARLILIDKEVLINPDELMGVMRDKKVTHLHATPALLQQVIPGEYYHLKRVIAAGETCPPVLAKSWSGFVTFYNKYGPTETTISSIQYRYSNENEPGDFIPIGKPIVNTQIYIVDEMGKLQETGESGEIYIGGAGVARGYLNRPDLTAEKFITNPFGDNKERLYKTGDIGRWLPDGNIQFIGRKDDQIKIHGHRVEPGEIEHVIGNYSSIQQCAVIADGEDADVKRLVAYIVSQASEDSIAVKNYTAKMLPGFMVPALIIQLEEFPLTLNGKVNKKALPKPGRMRPDSAVLFKAPFTETEKKLEHIWCALLQLDRVGTNDNFFDLGGNSLLAVKAIAALNNKLGFDLPVTTLYQHLTIHAIADFLDNDTSEKSKLPEAKTGYDKTDKDIAVIGMAGRFPGADTIQDFWYHLRSAKETTRFFADNELDPSISNDLKNDPNYVKARGIINKADEFDAFFFGINAKLAELMDPQHRVFMEIAWEALESAGYMPHKYNGSIGVFAGCRNNMYYYTNVLSNTELIEKVGSFQVMIANEKDYLATRTAHSLDLKGPAITVQSACSTSLLAIAQAVQSIRLGQCEMALAGGAAIALPVNSGYLYNDGAMLSNDGHCRPFDADAQGTVFSDGAGVVLLKNRERAEKDGDMIYALIKGVGINNDGGVKGSFTAPSVKGQIGAISMAINDAGIDPSTVSYIETHGTATPLGDPIEIEALRSTFGVNEKKQQCAIGSVKSNMGHLTVAAGVAGFIKTTLSLFYKQLVPTLFYKRANPNIDFTRSNFYVNTDFKYWESNEIRRAGVSAFGVGGTNVHIILEENERIYLDSDKTTRPQLICWSAKTENSRSNYAEKLAVYLNEQPGCNLADLAYNLHLHKQDFNARRFVVASNRNELIDRLIKIPPAVSEVNLLQQHAPGVVFMFPGQGSQYVNMGKELYENEPIFRDAVDECFLLLKDEITEGIEHIMYPEYSGNEQEEALKNTRYAQPALFIIEYAMARLWMSWGIHPAALVGHSVGEFVAAHLAGVFSLADALKLISTRGRMMSELPGGSMLSVRIEASKLEQLLPDDISIAAINSPGLCVVAGPEIAITAFANQLDEKAIANSLLHTSHAFHSSMMDPILGPFERVVASIQLSKPSIPIVSTVTGKWMTDAEAASSSYWASHLRRTVKFADAVAKLLEKPNVLLLETGPRNITSILARQQTAGKSVVVSSLESTGKGKSEYEMVMRALGQLWLNGVEPDWRTFYKDQKRRRIPDLPTYAFDRKYCWVNPMPVQLSKVSPLVLQVNSSDNNVTPQVLSIETPFMRKDFLIDKIKTILEEASGIEMHEVTPDRSFIEMGLDSLLLTQVAITLKKEFNLPVTFRQLNEAYGNLDLLAGYLDKQLPPDAFKPKVIPETDTVPQRVLQPASVDTAPRTNEVIAVAPISYGGDTALGLISQQLQIIARQVAMMQGGVSQPVNVVIKENVKESAREEIKVPLKKAATADLTAEEIAEIKKPFGASARIEKQSVAVNPTQKSFVDDLIKRYNEKTKKSKESNQQHRSYMADPRVVSGFKPLTKELVYSIVMKKSKGNRMWDLDGNEYIDVLNGFGSNLLGYQPDFVIKAIKEQIDKGFEIGPQHELAGEVCKLICEFTNFDRAALCSTGSEAVLGAMRIARTVTGRSLIVAFTGSYHGIVDEVIVRGTKKLKSFPAAPGIMPESVQNMLILDYGTDESLAIIRERAHEFAAVLIEPVQSRRADFHPFEFLKELRKITSESGAALIFDEVITGFRMHPRGIQGIIGIQSDLATYGKVIGGGIPIGVIAGKKVYMDALDGGFWQYGDDSIPEAGVTYFAGTFVRHPLALAAAKASLEYMKTKGPALQQGLNEKTEKLATLLNNLFDENGLPLHIVHFGSLWKVKFKEEVPYGELLFTLMRYKGVHVWDLFPCFMTDAFTEEDIQTVFDKFRESIQEMINAEIFVPSSSAVKVSTNQNIGTNPPFPGAKLGKDSNGNPAWFIQDKERPGKYLQVQVNTNK